MKIHNDVVRSHLDRLYGTVIDLGCGTKPYERDVLRFAERYIRVDWPNTQHGLHADIAADLNQPLPIADLQADCVLSFQVIEHLAEPAVMLSEARRILRPGGVLLLSAPFQWWVHEAPWDYQRFTRHGLQYQLQKAGFTGIEVVPLTGFWSMWLLKLNYQTLRLIRGTRLARLAMRLVLVPFWWTVQVVAPLLDRYWQDENETQGYFVKAQRP